MFHTHLDFGSKLYESQDPLILFGSILPDIAVTKIINWDNGFHGEKNNQKFKEFILEKYPQYLNLSKGVNAHNILDDTAHLNYLNSSPGFAFRNNQKLILLVQDFYQLDKETAVGIAHNYIECAVDICLLEKDPKVQ